MTQPPQIATRMVDTGLSADCARSIVPLSGGEACCGADQTTGSAAMCARRARPTSLDPRKREEFSRKKNTGDLQGENLRKYNISPCNREKKGNRPETAKNRREKQAETIQKGQGTALLAATKKPADEQRRATDRTNPRLGFQPSPILREKASEKKKALPLSLRSPYGARFRPARHWRARPRAGWMSASAGMPDRDGAFFAMTRSPDRCGRPPSARF